jgi:hypothetical protein
VSGKHPKRRRENHLRDHPTPEKEEHLMNFLKWIRECSTQRVSQQGATDSTRKMIIRADWLRKKISVEEAEADYLGIRVWEFRWLLPA